jgi:hypothetical protein
MEGVQFLEQVFPAGVAIISSSSTAANFQRVCGRLPLLLLMHNPTTLSGGVQVRIPLTLRKEGSDILTLQPPQVCGSGATITMKRYCKTGANEAPALLQLPLVQHGT